MKKMLLCFAMWGITGGLALAQSVQGTWELVSYDYGNGKKPMDPKRKQVKLITADHYIWAEYDIATGELKSASGGSYKYQNPSWAEHVDFADRDEVGMAGKDQQLKIVVKGDRLASRRLRPTRFVENAGGPSLRPPRPIPAPPRPNGAPEAA